MAYKATVAIACYNKEKSVARALDSLVAQSRFEEFEVIVVDDCSKDNSAEIVAGYAEKYPNVRLIRFEKGSGGPSRPRNVAIEHSTGDYLIFMDPDDIVINDGYSLLLTKMEEYRSDILIAARVGVTQAGQQVFVDFIDEQFTYVNQNTPKIRRDLLYRRPFILKTIYRKGMIVDNGIRFNENICTSEDESFDMWCVACADKITKINDVVYQYTVESEGSITTSIGMKVYESYYDVLAELYHSYSLSFDAETVAERLMRVTGDFYLPRVAFFDEYENIGKACECLYRAFDQFGREHFDALTNPESIALRDALYAHDVSGYVQRALFNRVRSVMWRYGKVQASLAETQAALAEAEAEVARQKKRVAKVKKRLAQAQEPPEAPTPKRHGLGSFINRHKKD